MNKTWDKPTAEEREARMDRLQAKQSQAEAAKVAAPPVPEPGFYWARVADKKHANFPREWPTASETTEIPWSTVEVSEHDGERKVWYPGCEEEMVVAEWGPRLEPPGSADPMRVALEPSIHVSEGVTPRLAPDVVRSREKVDLEELERKAMAAQAVDVAELRRKIEASLSRGREGIHRPVRVPEEIDAHIAANDPPVTLALIARIRELEEALGGALADWNSCDRYDDWQTERDARRAVLEKGAVLP